MNQQSLVIARITVLRTLAKSGLLAALLGLGASCAAAGNLYCCIDATGKQACGDILPQACYGRAYRELGATGQTARVVEAPLTTEQRAQRAADEERRKAEEVILKEKERKDQALLNTYSNEKDIEVMRMRAQDDIKKSVKDAETKIAEVRTRRKKFENEAEFYKKKQLPADVQRGLREADAEIKSIQSEIESKAKELELVRVKYDEDLRRYLELTKRGTTAR